MCTRRTVWAVVIAAAPLATSPQAGAQTAEGTAFTYQGRLTDGGAAASGAYDFQFILYDSSAGGSQVGAVLTRDDVTVTNGLFTVSLDFGSVFTGSKRWLLVGVRPGASSVGYTLLSPRQELTSAPHAVYSAAVPLSGVSGKPAGFADDADNDTLGGLSCANGEIAKRSEAAWVCGTDNAPTASQQEALVGTSRTPDASNPYVTNADPRNTNARAPLTHGSGSHDATVASRDVSGFVPAAEMGSGTASVSTVLRGDRTWSNVESIKPAVVTSTTGATVAIGATCTNYTGGQVTVTAPVSGTIIVRAGAWIRLHHTAGTPDVVQASIGTSATDCNGSLYHTTIFTINAEEPTMASAKEVTLAVRRIFTVSPGTYTYYHNAFMSSGADAGDLFYWGNMDGEFIPN